MSDDIKYLGDGSAVLVIGEAPARQTSLDAGRTLTEVPQSYVARLQLEEVENDALLDERPEFDEETQTWVQKGSEANIAPASTPGGASDVESLPARGEVQNTEQLQAEIDRLTAEKAALESAGGSEHTPPPPGPENL